MFTFFSNLIDPLIPLPDKGKIKAKAGKNKDVCGITHFAAIIDIGLCNTI